MRDLIVFLIVMLTLPTSFRRPFVGLLMFSWLAYMRPQDLCWGFARSMRLSFFVGMAMVAGWFAFERGRRPFARWDSRCTALIVLTVLVAMSYLLAKHHSSYFTRYFFEYIKIIVVALFTTGQVDSRRRFRAIIWMIAGCLAFYGVKGGAFGVLTGGASILRGPGGMMEDNNDFALALVMNVPLLWYLGKSDKGKVPFAQPATRMAILLTVVTILLTHSRGAFLALTGSCMWIAWRSGQLVRAGIGLMFAGLAFLAFAPQSVLDRLASIGDTQDSSRQARLTAWKIAFRMIEDNPLLGVGMRNFQPRYLDYADFKPTSKTTTYVAHNSYLQIWAESGTIAFGIYFGMLLATFVTCRRVFRMGQLRADMRWAMDYARMMEATIVGFMIGAFFLNRGHFDLTYHWLALVSALAYVAYSSWVRVPVAVKGQKSSSGGSVQVRRRGKVLSHSTGFAARRPAPRWGRTT